ncbi:MAG: hypothetical protein AAF573_01580 [Bacteroidota bacterium]
MKNNSSINIVIGNHRNDYDIVATLVKHLSVLSRQRVVGDLWYEDLTSAGADTSQIIEEKVKQADLILAVISIDYLVSKKRGIDFYLKLSKQFGKQIIPVIAKECIWQYGELENAYALPTNGNAIGNQSKWDTTEAPYISIVSSIKNYIEGKISFKNETSLNTSDLNSELKLTPSPQEIDNFRNVHIAKLKLLDYETHWNPADHIHLESVVSIQRKGKFDKKKVGLDEAILKNFKSNTFLLI